MTSRFRTSVFAVALLTVALLPVAATHAGPPDAPTSIPGTMIPIIGTSDNTPTKVLPPAGFGQLPGGAPRPQTATFVVNYTGFTAQAQTAFQAAVNVWAQIITSPLPITIDATWTDLGPASGGSVILGQAGPTTFYRDWVTGTPPPVANTFYPVALANKIRGVDNNGATAEISATFNLNADAHWYLGVDGAVPVGQVDFFSVVLHELGHGLGFTAGVAYDSAPNPDEGRWDISGTGYPTIYARGMVNASSGATPNVVTTYPNLADQTTRQNIAGVFIGSALYWNGTNAVAAQGGGNNPRLYAPVTWSQGSSISHLSESTYPNGNANSLMTPSINSQEVIHYPGPITLGMFQDMGWTVTAFGAATALYFQAYPPLNNTSGVAFSSQPRVAVIDAGANVVASDNTTQVTISNNGAGALSCTGGLTMTVTAGIAQYAGCAVTGGGNGQSLHAVSSPALSAANSGLFNITGGGGGATQLFFSTSPGNGATGVVLGTQPVVQVRDAGNAVVTGDNSTQVTLTSSAGAVACSGGNPKTVVSGVATFSGCAVTLAAGGVGIHLHATSNPALTAADSGNFNIVGNADHLTFTAAPAAANTNVAFAVQPVVQVRDAANQLVTGSSASITLGETGAGALSNCTTNPLAATAGVAAFAGCRLTLAGSYTLTAAAAGLTGDTTAAFNVTDPPPVAAAPTYNGLTGVTTTAVTVRWNDNANNEVGYGVLRYTAATGWVTMPLQGLNSTTFADSGLTSGTYYAYWVYAFTVAGDVDPTARTYAGSYMTVITPSTKPNPPTPVWANGASQTSVNVGWLDNSANETGFRVLRYSGGAWVDVSGLLAANTTSFTEGGRSAGTTYSYWIVSENAGGQSYALAYISANTYP